MDNNSLLAGNSGQTRVRYRAPISVFLNVTYRCNLVCVYCSADAGPSRTDELSPGEMRTLVESLIAHSVFRVIITGGEPFVRRDIFDIIAALKGSRAAVSINTNGTLLDQAACGQLRKLGVNSMSVSLDGHCSDVNDATRGRGAFQRATRGIRNLVEAGIQTGVLLVLTKRNVWALEETVEEVRRLGASSLSIGYLAPMGRGAGCCTGLSITASERRAAEGVIRRLQASNTGFVHEGFSYWDDYPRRLQCAREADCKAATSGQRCLLPCDAAKTFCAITADGWVLPCNKFDTYRCGNMREQSLSAIWQGPAMSRIRALSERPVGSVAACGSCTYHPICAGGCRALAYRAFGDLEAPDPSCAVLPDSAVHTLGSH